MPDSQDQTPSTVQTLKASILAKLRYSVGRDPSTACPHDWFEAVALAVRDHIIDHWEEAPARRSARAQAGLLPVPGVPHRSPVAG